MDYNYNNKVKLCITFTNTIYYCQLILYHKVGLKYCLHLSLKTLSDLSLIRSSTDSSTWSILNWKHSQLALDYRIEWTYFGLFTPKAFWDLGVISLNFPLIFQSLYVAGRKRNAILDKVFPLIMSLLDLLINRFASLVGICMKWISWNRGVYGVHYYIVAFTHQLQSFLEEFSSTFYTLNWLIFTWNSPKSGHSIIAAGILVCQH